VNTSFSFTPSNKSTSRKKQEISVKPEIRSHR